MVKGSVISINGGNKPNQMKEAIANLIENLPFMIEHGQLIAKLHKSKYDALLAEGFTQPEALELCKQVF